MVNFQRADSPSRLPRPIAAHRYSRSWLSFLAWPTLDRYSDIDVAPEVLTRHSHGRVALIAWWYSFSLCFALAW